MTSWKCVSEEFVLNSLIASPFMKPRFTPGGQFILGFDVKDGFCFGSYSFVNHCVKKSDFGV